MSTRKSRAKTTTATGGSKAAKKAEFTPKEINAARARLQEEIDTASITSRRSRLAAAAGLGSVGGLSAAAPGEAAVKGAAGSATAAGAAAGSAGAPTPIAPAGASTTR